MGVYPHHTALDPWEMNAEVERHTYPQLLAVATQLIKSCYSYTELAVSSIEPMTLQYIGESPTN